MRVLIAGCGDVGSALGLRLAAAGHEVWGLRRDPAGLPAGLRPLAADLADPASLAALPEGIEAVAYTAAAGASTPDAYEAAYVRGLDNLLAALAALAAGAAPVARVLFTSSTSVYGQSGGEWVDEDSPAEPPGFAGRILLQAERLLQEGPFPGVAVRLGGIYGLGRTRLLRQLRAGEARLPAAPLYTNRIHRDDCAGLLAHLLALDAPKPLYLGVDHDPADLREVYRWLARKLGVPPPPVAAPGEEGAAPAHLRAGSKRCSNARLLATGYRFLYPTYREGYRPLVEEARRGSA
jgi:nucleoside-diphosphate-sugar epimerase